MQTFIVTGSDGYLGRRVLTQLKGLGHDAMGVDIQNSDMNCDLSKNFEFPGSRFDRKPYLIHLASQFPGTSRGQNLLGVTKAISRNLLEESNNFSGAVVVSSTAVLRRNLGSDGPVVEPWEAYGQAKLEMEEDFLGSNISLQIIRPGTILGPERRGGIVELLKRAARGKLVILPSGGQVTQPFVHVNDVIRAICQGAVQADSRNGQSVTTLVASNPLTISQAIETWTGSAPKVVPLPLAAFKLTGSDSFPILGISKWHAGALLYDFPGFEKSGNQSKISMLDTIGSVIGFGGTLQQFD